MNFFRFEYLIHFSYLHTVYLGGGSCFVSKDSLPFLSAIPHKPQLREQSESVSVESMFEMVKQIVLHHLILCRGVFTVLIFFAVFFTSAKAEWVPFGPLGYLHTEYVGPTSTIYRSNYPGFAAFAEIDTFFPFPNQRYYLTLIDLSSGERVWIRHIFFPDSIWQPAIFAVSLDSIGQTQLILFSGTRFYRCVYTFHGEIATNWTRLNETPINRQLRNFTMDSHNNLYMIWANRRFSRVNAISGIEIDTPFTENQYSSAQIAPDNEGGAFVWTVEGGWHSVYHIFPNQSVQGPVQLYRPSVQSGLQKMLFCSNQQKLVQLEYEYNNGVQQYSIWLDPQTLTVNARRLEFSSHSMGSATDEYFCNNDSLWKMKLLSRVDSILIPGVNDHRLLMVNNGDSSWTTTDTLPESWFPEPTMENSSETRVIYSECNLAILWGNHGIARRFTSKISDNPGTVSNGNSNKTVVSSTGNYLHVSTAIVFNSITVWNTLGQLILSKSLPHETSSMGVTLPNRFTPGWYVITLYLNNAVVGVKPFTILY